MSDLILLTDGRKVPADYLKKTAQRFRAQSNEELATGLEVEAKRLWKFKRAVRCELPEIMALYKMELAHRLRCK
jgi:hypothetical protein